MGLITLNRVSYPFCIYKFITLYRVKNFTKSIFTCKLKNKFICKKGVFFKSPYKIIYGKITCGTENSFWRANPHFEVGGCITRIKQKLP